MLTNVYPILQLSLADFSIENIIDIQGTAIIAAPLGISPAIAD